MNPVISCRKLVKDYGRKKVLKGVDLDVPQGTIFALLGTNGAGKTTLIRTLLGLIPKTGGDIRVLEEEPYKIGPQLRQRIGYVSEEQGLYAWMTVQGIIEFCKSLYVEWDDELVERYLKQFKLDRTARIGTLSHGQEVKLALLLALAPKPELLILDEPMTGLDPLAQHEFLQVIMKDVNLSGRTIFFSTHNLADVNMVAKEVAILYDGRIQAHGTIENICGMVRKVKIKGKPAPEFLKEGVILSTDGDETSLLIPAGSEIAAASEGKTSMEPVTLEEAFLFFCSGGEQT